MTLIKKCDVENYRSAHPHKALRPFRPANEVGANHSSGGDSGVGEAIAEGFVSDFVLEHSSTNAPVISAAFSVKIDDKVAPVSANDPRA